MPVIEFREPAAHQPHNLIHWHESAEGQCLAVCHKDSLQVVSLDADLQAVRSRVVRLSDRCCSVMQARVLTIESQVILVLINERNIQFHDLRRDAVLYAFVPNDGPLSGKFVENFAAGICNMRFFIFIGLATGEILVISRLEDGCIGFEDIIRSPRSSAVTDVAADDGYVVSGDADGCLTVWEPDGQQILRMDVQFEASDPCSPVTAIQTHYDMVVAAYASGHIRVYGILQRRLLTEVHAHVAWINDMSCFVRGDGSFLISTGSDDSRVRIFSVHTVYPWIRHEVDHCVPNQQVVGTAFLSGGSQVAAIGYDSCEVSLFDVNQ